MCLVGVAAVCDIYIVRSKYWKYACQDYKDKEGDGEDDGYKRVPDHAEA